MHLPAPVLAHITPSEILFVVAVFVAGLAAGAWLAYAGRRARRSA